MKSLVSLLTSNKKKMSTAEVIKEEAMEKEAEVPEDGLMQYLHSPGLISDLLTIAETKRHLNRVTLLKIGLCFLGLCLFLSVGAGFVSRVVGFLYPAYESVKALHFENKNDEMRWLTYWVAFSFFHVLEFFSDILVWWIPFYWSAKTIFLMWCMAPISSNGATILYSFVIQPLYSKHHKDIDNAMDNAVKEAGEFLEKAAEKAKRMSVQ